MMTMDARQRPARVGELRPSQLLSSFGVGATVDLPHLSVMVMGLDDWSPAYTTAVTEERLLAAVRHSLGSQVSALRTAPWLPENDNPFDEWARVGVPVSVFPRWLRCPRCSILAPVSSGLFELKVHPVRTDRTRYEHANCSGARRAPPVLAARFLLACPAGHLDDFPWVEFTHRFAPCADPRLALRETGVSGQASDVQVRCRACGEDAQAKLPRCRGRHPHLATFTPGCDQPVGSILLGASNEWFGVRLRVLSIPARGERLAQLAADHWADLQHVTSPEVLRFARTQPQFGAFAEFGDDDLWAAVEARRSSGGEAPEDPEDLLGPEWAVFSEPDSAPSGGDFQLRAQPPPARFAGRVAQVVLAERLRERSPRAQAFRSAWREWCVARRIEDPDAGWPGMRFVLVHSLAHALIREFALECGYGAAGLGERLYTERTAGGRMAGLLLYTAAPDSEGTLGGLVELLVQALERAKLCSSDPLCAEHEPDARALHGAACHACMFAAETSCQAGNRFLDRDLLVETFEPTGLAFFG